MRSIINRKIYDTKNADEVARNHRHNRNNISWFNEVLYLTKNGAWFLAGEGGPLSKYSVDLGRGERDGGSALAPLTPEGAIAWLEEQGEYALIEAYFSDHLEHALTLYNKAAYALSQKLMHDEEANALANGPVQ